MNIQKRTLRLLISGIICMCFLGMTPPPSDNIEKKFALDKFQETIMNLLGVKGKKGFRRPTVESFILQDLIKKDSESLTELLDDLEDPNDFKKFITLQLRIAIFLTTTINKIPAKPRAFNYPEQELAPAVGISRFFTQWQYLLLNSLHKIRNTQFDRINNNDFKEAIHYVEEFLVDFGHTDLEFSPLNTEAEIKEAVQNNLEYLFNDFLPRMNKRRESCTAQLETMKEKLGIGLFQTNQGPIPNLLDALEIKNDELGKTVLQLALAKDYQAITHLVERLTDPNDLKKLLILQLNMALFIVDRISFDGDIVSYNAFNYPAQTILDSNNPVQAQWEYILLARKHTLLTATPATLDAQEFKIVLMSIYEFLDDIGYVYQKFSFNEQCSPDKYEDTFLQKYSIPVIKEDIAQNFKTLFEHLFLALRFNSSDGSLQDLKEKMRIQ